MLKQFLLSCRSRSTAPSRVWWISSGSFSTAEFLHALPQWSFTHKPNGSFLQLGLSDGPVGWRIRVRQRFQTTPLPPVTRLWNGDAAWPEHDGNGWASTSAVTPSSRCDATGNAMPQPTRRSHADPPPAAGITPSWSSSVAYDVPFPAAAAAAAHIAVPALAAPTRGATAYGPCEPPTFVPHRRSPTWMQRSSVSTAIRHGRYASQLPWFPSSS